VPSRWPKSNTSHSSDSAVIVPEDEVDPSALAPAAGLVAARRAQAADHARGHVRQVGALRDAFGQRGAACVVHAMRVSGWLDCAMSISSANV
jgi:hypothetical protein